MGRLITTQRKCDSPTCKTDHLFHIRDGDCFLTLVGHGEHAYIHVTMKMPDGSRSLGGIGNGRSLKLLAKAIMAEHEADQKPKAENKGRLTDLFSIERSERRVKPDKRSNPHTRRR